METEIPKELILSKTRVEEVVDARCMLIELLHDNGFYPRMIADALGVSRCYARRVLNEFPERLMHSSGLRLLFDATDRILKDKLKTT